MKYELWYSVVVRDRHGKVVSRERRRSKSFLKAWNQMMYVRMAQTPLAGVVPTSGIPRTINELYASDFAMNAAAGYTLYGIRVGTGNTPVALDDYALEIPIEEGAGAGQMSHLVCTVATSVVAAPSCSFLVSRSIVNNSPGIITVREAAIYIGMQTGYCCGIRDVFGAPQAVPIGGGITMDWTLQVTV